MEVKEALKRFRQRTGLKQEEVAEKLGIKRQAYQPYETGKVAPSIKMIIKMSNVFDVSTDYLLGLSDEPRPKPADEVLINEISNCRDSIQRILTMVDNVTGGKANGRLQDNEQAQRQTVYRANAATA